MLWRQRASTAKLSEREIDILLRQKLLRSIPTHTRRELIDKRDRAPMAKPQQAMFRTDCSLCKGSHPTFRCSTGNSTQENKGDESLYEMSPSRSSDQSMPIEIQMQKVQGNQLLNKPMRQKHPQHRARRRMKQSIWITLLTQKTNTPSQATYYSSDKSKQHHMYRVVRHWGEFLRE